MVLSELVHDSASNLTVLSSSTCDIAADTDTQDISVFMCVETGAVWMH